MTESESELTETGHIRYSRGHQIRVAVSVPLLTSRRLLKQAGIPPAIDELTEKIVRSIEAMFDVTFRGSNDTSDHARDPEQAFRHLEMLPQRSATKAGS